MNNDVVITNNKTIENEKMMKILNKLFDSLDIENSEKLKKMFTELNTLNELSKLNKLQEIDVFKKTEEIIIMVNESFCI